MSTPRLEDLEQAAMALLLSGEGETSRILREQYNAAEVQSRELTGVGFFTYFRVPLQVPRLDGAPSFELDAVAYRKHDLYVLGLVLFVRDGLLEFLEGSTYGDDAWPDDLTCYVIVRPDEYNALWQEHASSGPRT